MGVCDSPTTGKCNAVGMCESVIVPGLACDPEDTPNLCISNTSGTCDVDGLLCTAGKCTPTNQHSSFHVRDDCFSLPQLFFSPKTEGFNITVGRLTTDVSPPARR
jgi:hypothetical protein